MIPEPHEKLQRITLELTNHCNLSCHMCPRHYMQYPQGFMPDDLFRKIVDEMADCGITVLVPFFRGESLLHPEFLNLMAYAKEKTMTVQLATNGVLMTGHIAEELVRMGLDFVSFSVDSIDEKHYREMRSNSDLSDLLSTISFMLKEKERTKSSLPEIQVSAVDTGLSEETKELFVSHWSGKVQRVRIYPQHTKGGDFGSLEQSPPIPRRPCHKPFTEMVIYWDGKAALCNHDWDRHDTLGDASVQGIMDIWQSPPYQQVRQRHLTSSFEEKDVCRSCAHWAQYYEKDRLIGELYTGDREGAS